MSLNDILGELKSAFAVDPEGRLPQNAGYWASRERDIARWVAASALPRSVLYDRLALALASGFDRRELSFEFCDWVVNQFHAAITLANEDRPDWFWRVFLAFDAGEYYHDPARAEDPVETYTRPQIADIIRDFGNSADTAR
jgi:hypothetical protein